MKTREEVIEEAAAIIYGQPPVVGGRSYAEARARLDAKALDEAGLLATPEVLRCVEACKKAADQTWFGPPAFAAERDCRDAGRAMLAKDDGPWGDVEKSPAGGWWFHREWDAKRERWRTECGPFETEAEARRTCDALNSAWRKP